MRFVGVEGGRETFGGGVLGVKMEGCGRDGACAGTLERVRFGSNRS